MKSKRCTWLLAACSTLFLASCAGITVPNLRPVNPVPPSTGVGAIFTETNSKKEGEMSPAELVYFLYAQADAKGRPIKGPASCFSSDDAEKIMAFLESACVKVNCNYDQFSSVVTKIRASQDKATALALRAQKPLPAQKLRKK